MTETIPTPEHDPDDAPDATPRSTGRRWRVRIAAASVLVILAVALGIYALDQRSRADDLAATDDVRGQVADAAGAFGEALLSYDHTDLNAARGRVLELSTDRFDQEYTAGVSTGPVAEQIVAVEATATAVVRTVYVAEVAADDDAARAVVSVDSEVTSNAGSRRTVGSFLELSLVLVGDDWLVDSVTSLAALDEQITPAPGSEDPAGG